ncbi:MAG: hypothetical protein C0506_05110 [Anaerolinea sp.]|nr:hypothetical protein [Anaerolinea sp.]
MSRAAEEALARTRCPGCGKGLSFDEWSSGFDRCGACRRFPGSDGPAATYVQGPATRGAIRSRVAASAEDYERLLENVPDALIDELVAALEAEAAHLPPTGASPVHDVLREIGFGRSPRELQWAAWGFSGGFAANVALAKYAQMASGAAMSQFIVPMLLGGVVAGVTCAAIGWGLARLRER